MVNMQAKTHQFDRLMPYLLGSITFGCLLSLAAAVLLSWQIAISGFVGSCLFWMPNMAFAFCCMQPKPRPSASIAGLVKGQFALFGVTIFLWVVVLNSSLYNLSSVMIFFAAHWLVLPLWGILKSR